MHIFQLLHQLFLLVDLKRIVFGLPKAVSLWKVG